MTKNIIWRLKELPTPETLAQLVKDGILSKDETREILFSSETEEDRDKKSLESEIKFLRELVEKLSGNSRITEVIKEVERPYRTWRWYKPYEYWCSSATRNNIANCTYATNGSITLTADAASGSEDTITRNFSDIKTF